MSEDPVVFPDREKELLQLRLTLQEQEDGLEEAWRVINVLHSEALDRKESWPRALTWLQKWKHMKPKQLKQPNQNEKDSYTLGK